MKNILNFVEFVKMRDGRVKLRRASNLEENVNRSLRDSGFRTCRIPGGRIYYHRQNDTITNLRFDEIRDSFTSFIEQAYLDELPEGVSFDQFMNWYYATDPVKETQSLKSHLEEPLTKTELHTYRMTNDFKYRKAFELNELHQKLQDWDFSQAIDTVNSKSKKNSLVLHYKPIDSEKLLVITQWNAHDSHLTGFDADIFTYKSTRDVGIKNPISRIGICESFKLSDHYKLIEQYL